MEHVPESSSISDEDYLQAVSDFAEAFTFDISPNYFHAALIGRISNALAEGIELCCTERSAISLGIQRGRTRQKAEQTTDAIPRQASQLQSEPRLGC